LAIHCSRGGEAQELLQILSDAHGAENVEEDEAAVREVFARQIPMRQSLDPGDRCERQLRHHSTVEYAIESAEQSRERETDGEHRLHLEHRQVPIGHFQSLFFALDLSLALPIDFVQLILFSFKSLSFLLNVRL